MQQYTVEEEERSYYEEELREKKEILKYQNEELWWEYQELHFLENDLPTNESSKL